MNMSRRFVTLASILAIGVLFAACSDTYTPTDPAGEASFDRTGHPAHTAAGHVYLMSNADGPNQVLVYRRAPDGSLTAEAPVATGGYGTGSGLGNQAAVVLSKDGRWLLVVNPGSDDVSVFRVGPDGLYLTDVEDSGGEMPVSVDLHGSLVYVLNAGSPNNVTGFTLGNDGSLTSLSGTGSTRPLSAASTGPAQVGFTPDGQVLVVTEKATDKVTTFTVGSDGLLSMPYVHDSAGQTPFGFGFDHRGRLIVSEATSGSVSSYWVDGMGGLTALDPAVTTTETAACWIVISRNGRYAYTTNGGSGSVTGFLVGPDGSLEILDADGRTGVTGSGSVPLDAAFSLGGRYMYVLSSGIQEVSVFRFEADGGLTLLPGMSGLPATANGMAAR